MALKRVWIPSPNFSSRGGAAVRLIVVHTAEGARTIESLGAFFQGNVEASSHVGADDKPSVIGEYVKRSDKAWTVANYNPVSVNIELCGFASWSADEWRNDHANMLKNCAAWIAEEAKYYKIPIQKLSPAAAQGSGRGVCAHSDLGAAGGGHHDPGPGFPWTFVLEMARAFNLPAKPASATGEANASVTCHFGRKTGIWEVHGTKGDVTFGPKDEWEKAEIRVNRKTGAWRIKSTGRSSK